MLCRQKFGYSVVFRDLVRRIACTIPKYTVTITPAFLTLIIRLIPAMNDEKTVKLAESLVSSAYIKQALQARHQRETLIRSLLEHVRACRVLMSVFLLRTFLQGSMPPVGWDDDTIKWFLNDLALMDSNNFIGELLSRLQGPFTDTDFFCLTENVGVGEREARIYNRLVLHHHKIIAVTSPSHRYHIAIR